VKSLVAEVVECLLAELEGFMPSLASRGATVCNARPAGERVPTLVQEHFVAASALARQERPAVNGVLDALEALVPQLAWHKRPSDGSDKGFDDGHFNAIIAGNAGLVSLGPVLMGVSVMAPGVTYPTHRHPPDECYIALCPGQWWREGQGWWAPGIGNLVHNPGNQLHAMRSGSAPHLSLWVLTGKGAAGFASGS